jgi:recombination protein RecA
MAAKSEGAVKTAPDLLKGVVKAIQKKYGNEAAIRLAENTGSAAVPYWISTGALNFDAVLGGGIAGGRIVELFSRNESEGKTSVAAHIARECQKVGGYVLYADMEQTIHEAYFRTLGVNVEDQFLLSRPDTLEHLCSIIEMFAIEIRDAGGDALPLLVVVDSVAATQTKAQLDAEYEDRQVAEQARAVSAALRKLNPVISQTQTTLLLLNQSRTKIGVMFGDPDDTPGGRAMKFYASQRIILRKAKAIKQIVASGEEKNAPIIGIEIEATIKKNKVAAPFGKAMFEFYFGSGINYPASVFDFGLSRGVFIKEGLGQFTHKKYGGKFRRADFIMNFEDPNVQKIHEELRALAMEPPEFIAVTDEKEEEEKDNGSA